MTDLRNQMDRVNREPTERKAAIYCRLSQEDFDKPAEQTDSSSIRNQKTMLLQYAGSMGWTIYDVYVDDDYSGTDRTRPEFNRLIRDAREGRFQIILCKSQSRFTREMEQVETYINGLFPRLGIRFVSLVDSTDSENKGNNKARQINGLVNEWFLEELSENIRAVLTSRREQGYHIGSFAPYGYRKDPTEKGHLIMDPEAAEIVREIYTLYLSGQGKYRIARILNERGVPNPTEYKRLHGQIRNQNAAPSVLWSYYTVSSILSNPVYIGDMVQGKSGVMSYKIHQVVHYPKEQWIRVNGTHEPIIDQETWDRVQALAASKTTPAVRGIEGIFARKVQCMYCGVRMHSVKNGNKRSLKCHRHTLSPNSCTGASISLRKLERIVSAQLCLLSEAYLDEAQIWQAIDPVDGLAKEKKMLEAEIRSLRQKTEELDTVRRSLYLNKVRANLSEAEHIRRLYQWDDEKSRLEDQVSTYLERISHIESCLKTQENKRLPIRKYITSRHLTKDMVTFLIDHILVGKRNSQTGETPVEIHWNF